MTPSSQTPCSRASTPPAASASPTRSATVRSTFLKLSRIAAAAAALALLTPAHAGPTGSIQGRVQNSAAGRYLNNARVRISGTNIEVFTNQYGEFTIPNAPAGAQTLEVFYTGLTEQTMPVSVAADQTSVADIALVDDDEGIITLDVFSVAARKETDAQALAINEQRFSPNLKNVVSTDAFGEVNQGNIGEFVKHMPGVNIESKDGNNPSGITIRGFGTNFIRVTKDGNSMASAAIANTSSPNRQFVLEGTSINSIARIEVVKEPLPDMPANTMGGGVNLISKNAFEYDKQQITFGAYLSANSEALDLKKSAGPRRGDSYKALPSFDATWVLPISKTLGVVASFSNYDQFYNSIKAVPGRAWTTNGATVTNPITRSISATISPNQVTSTSGSVKIDWKPTRGQTLSLSASALAYKQDSSSHVINLNAASSNSSTPLTWSDTFTHGAAGGATGSMGGSWQNRNALTRSIAANYTVRFGDWTLDAAATYSNANNRVRDTDKGFFNSVTTGLRGVSRIDLDNIVNRTSSFNQITAYDASGSVIDTTKLANYHATTVGSQPMTAHDSVTEYRVSLKRDLELFGVPFSVKTGAYSNNLARAISYSSIYWTFVGADGVEKTADDTLSQFIDTGYSGTSPDHGLPGYEWLSPWAVYDTFKSHPTWFTQTSSQLSDIAKNDATRSPLLYERVTAGYLMSDVKLFQNRLTVVGGVRYELTENRGYGYKQTGSTYVRRGVYNERDYHGYYPSVSSVLNILDNLLLRAAFAKTMGRPSPSDIVPNITVKDPNGSDILEGSISTNNSTLVPWSAKNYDLSLEYYTEDNGVISLGVFRKDIRNFFMSEWHYATQEDLASLGLPDDKLGYKWTTRVNGGDARIDGIEFGFSQQLGMLGSWGRCFTVTGNYTRMRVLGSYSSSFNLKSNGGNIPETANTGVTFARGRFSIGTFLNYRGWQFRDTSSSYTGARENVRSYYTFDATASYKLTEHFTVFAAGRNMNNATIQWSLDGPDAPEWSRISNDSTNGAQYSAGVRASF